MSQQSLLTRSVTEKGVVLVARGAWTAPNAKSLEAAIAKMGTDAAGVPSAVDVAGVNAFDTYGAWLLERLTRVYEGKAHPLKVTGLSPHFESLFNSVRATNRAPEDKAREPWSLGGLLAALGRHIVDNVRELGPALNMLGAAAAAAGRVVMHPSRFRLTSTVNQLDRVGWQAIPIVSLITFLIGCIIAQQGFFHFRRFGAESYVVDLVGVLITREIGVLLVVIMVAGRSGSSYTAELGSMKMREEIDALKTMGRDPVEILILPRLLALLFAVPILTFIGLLSALFGAGLVAWGYGDMHPQVFLMRLNEAITITHFKVGMVKAPFMALAIGLVACSEGLRVKGSAESLGHQTTISVVKSIFLVIILDGLFAIFFAAIRM